jgi:hypothetical protein
MRLIITGIFLLMLNQQSEAQDIQALGCDPGQDTVPFVLCVFCKLIFSQLGSMFSVPKLQIQGTSANDPIVNSMAYLTAFQCK